MSILQTTELKKYYGTEPNITRALDGVNLSVEQGEFVAIVGTSGSGKSTLLNMIGGLDVPTSGKVIVDGRDLSTLKDEQLTIFRRRKIGFIFQNYNLVPVLNVFENIVLPVELDGNKVDSSIFAENAVTVVNFWFNECKPCVEELSEMNALNDRIKEQGGEVIGVNVGTLDNNEENIATAKQILETKGAKYRNIYFDSDSDAGKFALGVTAFPTTYVIDRNGNIVGEALLGGINNDDNLNTLQSTIDEVLAKDAQK